MIKLEIVKGLQTLIFPGGGTVHFHDVDVAKDTAKVAADLTGGDFMIVDKVQEGLMREAKLKPKSSDEEDTGLLLITYLARTPFLGRLGDF